MNFNKYLGLSTTNNFNIIAQDIQKYYKINGKPSTYSCNLELLSYNTDNKCFNNRHKLFRLLKQKYRHGYSGFVFKALLRNNNKRYYKNIFMKEIPIYPANINYYTVSNPRTLSNSEYKQNYFKYNTDSSPNIEIFLSYVCSRMFELNISPSFCLFYGYYYVNFKFFSYVVNNDIVNLNSNNKVFTTSGNTILRKENCPAYLLALEKLDFDIFTIKELTELDLIFFKSLIFQIYAAVFTMFTMFGVKHNDLHVSNIMFKITNKKFIYYKLGEVVYKIPTYGFIVKIIDWGRGVYNHNSIKGNNSIFNTNAECENQLIFTRINKTPYENYDWMDIVIITQNILYNFPDIKEYPSFYKFLKQQLKTTKGIFISTQSFNWETYENIAKNKFNINPINIINNTEFNNFITREKHINDNIYNIYLPGIYKEFT